ncbi:sulfur carrier protein ThiS [Francisellaceae bacterium]|nr:sulfur carrier protein ThiS [Francisellaceae bacterium]
MQVKFNGKNINIEDNTLLVDFLRALSYDNQFSAVAINQELIQKSHYQKVSIQPQDQIELLTPMQGG